METVLQHSNLTLNRLTTFEQLLEFIPNLTQMYEEFDGLWAPELDREAFIAEVMANFGPKSYYFADKNEAGEVLYFTAVFPQDSKRLFFWLFYMNPKYRAETKRLIFDMIAVAKADGYVECYTSSTRKESSYERWIEKFGAEKMSVTYRIKL